MNLPSAANPVRTPANQSQFTFRVQGLADNSFGVKEFRGENQALDQDYRFEVALQSPDLILPERVIGQAATLELLQPTATTPMIISGVVCAFTWDEAAPGSRGYVATLASPLYPLTLRNNQRIFLNRSIPQIIEEVLTQAGLNATVEMELQGEYPARAYTVQYDESDWDFITRLAAGCGIFFRIEAEQEQAHILFYDAVDKLPTLPGTGTLLYQPPTGANRAQETIFSFNTRAEVLTDGVDLRDYNYRTPEALLDASASRTVSAAGHGRDYRYGENHKDLDQATQLAKLRQQQLDWQRQLYYAASDCRTVAPGLRLTMTGHPEIDLNGEYLIVAVEQQGQQKSALAYGKNSQGMTYRNRLTLIPFGTPYRPKLPQLRRNHGVFTAHIETTGGTYAYLDDQGRYRVRLVFDGADTPQGQASHAARLLQPYSGDNFGTHTPLHAGTEVALTCVNGDLDRPIILGVLPNPQTPSPVNATNHSQNILRTFGGNELLLEDRKEQERIELFTRERNNILNLDAQESGHKVSLLTLEGEMELYAAKTLLKESGDTHSTVVGANHLITVENSQRLMTKNQQIELKAATDIRIKAGANIHLQAEKRDIQLRADKDMIVRAAAGMAVEVRNENLNLLVQSGELSIDVAKEINILGQGGGAITISQSGGAISIDPQGNINIDSHTVDINGQSVSIDGAQSSQGGGGSGASAGSSSGSNPEFGLLTTLPGAARKFFEPSEDPDAQSEVEKGAIDPTVLVEKEDQGGTAQIELSQYLKVGAISGYPETGENAWRSANDEMFSIAVESYNKKYGLKNGDPGHWTVRRLKAQAMIESGGHREAFITDPLQVNNPGDWVPEKSKLGLVKNEIMTPEKSSKTALEWLKYKGWKHDSLGNEVEYRGDAQALRRYNGNIKEYSKHPGVEHRDWYAAEILSLEKTTKGVE